MSALTARYEDFDDWAELARVDPEAFERRRREVIDAFIESAPERNREHLRCLQWRIDMERRRASNPVSACYRIYRMMWDSFAGERGLMSALQEAGRLCNGDTPQGIANAEVLEFKAVSAER